MSSIPTTPIADLSFVEGENLSDSAFPADDLANAEALMAQFLSDRFPKIGFASDGTLYEFLVRPGVVPYMISRRMLESFRMTMSLKGLQENPSLANPSVTATLLSNYLVSQDTGYLSYGKVKVRVENSRPYRIQAGTTFTTSDGLVFSATSSFTATPQPLGGELPLYSSPDGTFFFLLPVSSTQVGGSYNIPSGTELSPSVTISGLILCVADGNFAGGSDGEGFEDIEKRVLSSLASKNMVGEASIFSTVKASIPSLLSSNTQGMGDELIYRNRRTMMGAPAGGIVDAYFRTSETPVYKDITLVATPGETAGIYTGKIGRDDFPGHYGIKSIRPASGKFLGTYKISSVSRAINNTVTLPSGKQVARNLISQPIEGTYSRWMETSFEFEVQPSDIQDANGGNLNVVVRVFGLPDIDKIQDLFSAEDTRVGGTDYLARAFVPCFVSTSPMFVKVSKADPSMDGLIRSAVMTYINRLAPGEGVRVDGIVKVITSIPGVKSVDLPIMITGNVYCPDESGTVATYSSRNILEVPMDEVLGIGPANTVFFAEADQIPITISE